MALTELAAKLSILETRVNALENSLSGMIDPTLYTQLFQNISAKVSSLIVHVETQFEAIVTFTRSVTFSDLVTFRDRVIFLDRDMAGQATISAGGTSVYV